MKFGWRIMPLLALSAGLAIPVIYGWAQAVTPVAIDLTCLGETECRVGERGYHVLPPDDWDGVSKLPVLLYFHGWKRQGFHVIKHSRIAPATRKHGYLLLAPNGLHRSWDFWQAGTNDVPFAIDALEDAAKRWPIDQNRIYVAGYSWGSSMAWRFVCRYGDRVAGLLAISGTLTSQYEECPTGPVNVRHVHGLRDNVMDFPFGPNGEKTHPVRLWLDKNGCRDDTQTSSSWNVTKKDSFTRYSWQSCNSGKTVSLDVHQRGHFIPVGWINRQLEEIAAER